MKLKSINGLTADDLMNEAEKGSRFICFECTVSVLVVSFKRKSEVYLVGKGEKLLAKALFFTLISILFGWWALPDGPKNTIESIKTNVSGGRDVTDIILERAAGYIQFREAQKEKIVHHQFNS